MNVYINAQDSQHHAVTTCRNNTIIIQLYKKDYSCFLEDFNYLKIELIKFLNVFLTGSQNISFGLHSSTYKTYQIYIAKAKIAKKIIFFIIYFPNRILQAVFTQPENDSPSFLACCWINSSRSSSKRIVCLVLFERSLLLFAFFSCIGAVHYDKLHFIGAVHYKSMYHKKQSPEVLPALSRDLTKPLNEVMIMANRYDSAHLRARQSKLFRFYDLSTCTVHEVIASTEKEACSKLGNIRLVFIARKRLYPTIESQSRNYCFGGFSYE